MENIVYASAHPDDLGGSSGTLLRLKDRYNLHLFDMTRGESGLLGQGVSFDECASMRTAEEEKVAEQLNAKLYFLGEKDIAGEPLASRETLEYTAKLLAELKPRAMFVHWPLDVHNDHISSHALMMKALRFAMIACPEWEGPEIFYHDHTVQSKGFSNDFYVDITSVFEAKNAIIRTYACQNGDDFLVRHKVNDAIFHGGRCGVKYAECFAMFHRERLRNRPNVLQELAFDN